MYHEPGAPNGNVHSDGSLKFNPPLKDNMKDFNELNLVVEMQSCVRYGIIYPVYTWSSCYQSSSLQP